MDLSVFLRWHRNNRFAVRSNLEFAIYLWLHRRVTDLDRDRHRFDHGSTGCLHLGGDIDIQAALALWHHHDLLHIEIRAIAVSPLFNLTHGQVTVR